MSNIDYNKYIDAIFEPILAETNMDSSRSKLKTIALSKKTITVQNSIIKSFKLADNGPIETHNSNFLVRFSCINKSYYAISVDGIADASKLIDILTSDGLEETILEIGMFMSLCYHLKYIYKTKSSYDKNTLIEKLGLGVREDEDDYCGHNFEELIDAFKKVIICEIPLDSIYLDKSDWYVVAKFAANYDGFRLAAIHNNIIDIAKSLLELSSVNPENIYLSLTSSHWKHCFLEIYRCLEAIYFLPWMLKLAAESESPHNAFKLARICSKTVLWREKEEASIRELLSLIPLGEVTNAEIGRIKALSGLPKLSEPEYLKTLASRIYKIRNQCVHQEDYEEIAKISVTSDCWPVLTLLIYKLVKFYYSNYEPDIRCA